jgi:hypothetical protein
MRANKNAIIDAGDQQFAGLNAIGQIADENSCLTHSKQAYNSARQPCPSHHFT